MIAIDTNIIIRLLTQDDEQQYIIKSFQLFQEQNIFTLYTVFFLAEEHYSSATFRLSNHLS